MLRIDLFRILTAGILFFGTVVFMIIGIFIDWKNLYLLLNTFYVLTIATYIALTPSVVVRWLVDNSHSSNIENKEQILLIILPCALSFYSPFAAVILLVLIWSVFAIFHAPHKSAQFSLIMILFLIIIVGGKYLVHILGNDTSYLKLFTKYILSSYLFVLSIACLFLLRKIKKGQIILLLFITSGQLFISLFDIAVRLGQ